MTPRLWKCPREGTITELWDDTVIIPAEEAWAEHNELFGAHREQAKRIAELEAQLATHREALWPFVKFCKVESMKGHPPDDATPIMLSRAGSMQATVTGAEIHRVIRTYDTGGGSSLEPPLLGAVRRLVTHVSIMVGDDRVCMVCRMRCEALATLAPYGGKRRS